MKRLKHWLLVMRFKHLLGVYEFKKGLEFWFWSKLGEDDKSVKHRRECDDLMLSLRPEDRTIVMDWKQKKIDYLVVENTKDKTEATQNRLFQALLEYNQIRAVHEAAKMREELAKLER